MHSYLFKSQMTQEEISKSSADDGKILSLEKPEKSPEYADVCKL